MLLNLDIQITSVPKFLQPVSPLLYGVAATSLIRSQVRTIEGKLAGIGDPGSPSITSAPVLTIELLDCPRRQRENLA